MQKTNIKFIWSKIPLLLLCTLLCYFSGSTQKLSTGSLKPGDRVPEIYFQHVLNLKKGKLKLSDFAGKLVILDMWSSWCSSCIAGFPRMESLQKQFHDNIQILLVNPHQKNDSEKRVRDVLKKFKERTGFSPTLPIPLFDTVLNQYFPHESVPHVVWIDQNRKVVGITLSKEVTADNIRSVLRGKKITFPIKNDQLFDPSQPMKILHADQDGDNNPILYRSVITKGQPEYGNKQGQRGDEHGLITGYFMLNTKLQNLIRIAYSEELKNIMPNRVIIEGEQLQKYMDPKAGEEAVFCYDLTLPPISQELFNVENYLKEDLTRTFGLSVKLAKRTIPVLRMTGEKLDKLRSTLNQAEIDLEKRSIRKYMHGISVQELAALLDAHSELPVVCDFDSEYRLDIAIPSKVDPTKLEDLLIYLGEIGFRFHKESQEMTVAIISQQNNP